ncbi:MAG TPA: PilZ domain-containing protein [Rhizobiaceae bacterium]|nr:PilZ domain-containing protein [Rhizobiaceae bacterium]
MRVEENDARQATRNEALNGAMILDTAGNPGNRCLVTNISAHGAELELVENVRVPPRFTLHVPHQGLAYKAEVRWRENGRIGVEFFGHEKMERPALKKVVG